MGFENKNLEDLHTPEEIENSQEKSSFLEKMRKRGFFHPVTLVVGAYLIGMGVFEGFKVNEYFDLKSKKEKIETAIRTIDPENNRQKLRELYGHWFQINDSSINYLEGQQSKTEQELKHFSWFNEEIGSVEPIKESTEVRKGSDDLGTAKIESGIPSIIEREKVELDTLFLREVLRKTFPRNWFEGEISIIRFKDTKEFDPDYGIFGGESWADFNRGNNVITFYAPARSKTVHVNINDCLAHELGHVNDWESDKETSFAEKVKLLLDVTNRLNEEDRYNSPYVELIKNEDEKRERYLKATEYWAEICGAYFSLPEYMNYKDFKLVDDWVQKQDSDFNVKQANGERHKIIANYHEHLTEK